MKKVQKIGIRNRFYRWIAGVLVVTMLPFYAFADAGVLEVQAQTWTDPVSANQAEGTEDLIIEENLVLTEDLTVQNLTVKSGCLDLNGFRLDVCGDLLHTGGVVVINGGKLSVLGDYHSLVPQEPAGYSDSKGCLVLNKPDDYMLVAGEFIWSTLSKQPMTDGILELQGDAVLGKGFVAEGNHRMILSGDDTQHLEAVDGAIIGQLELDNQSEGGVVIGDGITWERLLQNGCAFTVGDNSGYRGYTLTEDETVSGNFWLKEGTLDLNGHTMTVEGSLLQESGTIAVNGGRLIVKGDYRRQDRIRKEDGSYEFGYTYAVLEMNQDADYVYVGGDYYDSSRSRNMLKMCAGCMELKGNLYLTESSWYGRDYTSGTHRLLISGERSQTLQFTQEEKREIYLMNLEITNTSKEGVTIIGEPLVYGRCESDRESRIKGRVCKAGYDSEWGAYYGGDIAAYLTMNLNNDFELGGDLYLYNKLTVMATAKLVVDGNVWMSDNEDMYAGGYFYLDGGTLAVRGDVTGEGHNKYSGYSGINFSIDGGSALIEGDYRILSTGSSAVISTSYGTLEVKGDLDIRTETCYGGTVILSGEEKQTVSLANSVSFGTLVLKNYSEEGIVIDGGLFCNQLIDTGCKITYFGLEGTTGETLSDDRVVDGDLVLISGTMDLNGHTLTVKGDLIQTDATMNINGGTLVVEGGYYLGNPETMWDDNCEDSSTGYLNMTTDEDYVLVNGDFFISWGMPYIHNEPYYSTRSRLTAGTLEVKGDFVQKESTDEWGIEESSFPASGSHRLLLSGDKKQVVMCLATSPNGSHIANLEIANTGAEGVEFRGEPCVTGQIAFAAPAKDCPIEGMIGISSVDQLPEGGYRGGIVNCGDLVIDRDLIIEKDMKIDGTNGAKVSVIGEKTRLCVGGDLTIYGDYPARSNLALNGACVEVGGNVYNHSGIIMNDENACLTVQGNYENDGEKNQFRAGTLKVGGDFRDESTYRYGNVHRVLLCGDHLQTIDIDGAFGILELQNYSEEGVYSEEAFKKEKLILNGCRLTIGDGTGVYGYRLEEDTVMTGGLTLVGDTLDLNGHTLTVKGDLLLSEGKLEINHGCLIVEGDLRIQKKKKSEAGVSYEEGNGQLLMRYEDDRLIVGGDCILQSGRDMSGDCTEGRIALSGSLVQTGSNGFVFGGSLVLEGGEKQRIDGQEQIVIGDCVISNRSEEGVEIASEVKITGTVKDSGKKAGGEGSIVIDDLSRIEGGYYGGSVILDSSSAVEGSLEIGGALHVTGELHLGEDMVRVGELMVDGRVFTDRSTVIIEKGLTVQGTGLFAMTDAAYVLVKGDVLYSTTTDHQGYLTDGTLEILGDFTQKGSRKNFMASGDHYTIFRRRNVTGQTVTQTLSMFSYNCLHFAALELTANVENAYEMYVNPERIADRVVYITPGSVIPEPVSSIVPKGVTVTSVEISYDGNFGQEEPEGYVICRDGVKIGVTKEKTFEDTGLKPGTTYRYEVYPYNADKNSPGTSPILTVTLPEDEEAPSAPGDLFVKYRTGSAVMLIWDKSTDNVGTAGYRLYRRTNDGAEENGKSGDGSRDGELIYEGDDTEFRDEGLEVNTLYTYYVTAYDEAGNESEADGTVDGVVCMPQILSITPEDYEIVGGETLELTAEADDSGRSGIYTVDIEYYDETAGRWTVIGEAVPVRRKSTGKLAATCLWDLTKVGAQTDVDVRFTIADADGNRTEQTVSYSIDRRAPEAPEEITAQDDGGTVVVNWNISKSADCAGYELYRINMDTGTGEKRAQLSGRNTSWYRDSEVEDGATYRYYLRSYDAFMQKSPMSETAEITIGTDTQAPRVVTMTPASGKVNQKTELVITGKDNRLVEAFELYIRQDSEEVWQPFATVDALDNTGSFLWDTTQMPENTYYIKAVAVDRSGNESTDLFMRRFEVDNTGIAKIRLREPSVSSTAVQLTWEDVTEDDFGWFSVEELIKGNWKEIAEVTAQLGYRAEGMTPESTHTYRVTGYDTLGNKGIPSDPLTVTTAADTSAPVITKIEPVSSAFSDRISLSMEVKDDGGVDYGRFSYSVSGNDFEEIATVTGKGGTTENLSCLWDISGIPEGEVTVRFEAWDTVGLHNLLYEESQIENTYIIDRQPPEKVTGVRITNCEGSIALAWDSVSDNDIASYTVERAVEGEGIFTKVCSTDRTLFYTDCDVRSGVVYIYRIVAVDAAGNLGEPSNEVYGMIKPDKTAPVVTGISPGTTVFGANQQLKVLATDNCELKEIRLEYRMADGSDYWHPIDTVNADGRAKYCEVDWDTEGLSEGILYEVRAKAVDAAGNESEYKLRNYELDLTAPKTPELTAESGSFRIELNYTENTEEDFRCYKIYRREYGESEYTCIQATIQNTFTDIVPKTDTVYYYKVRAYDIYDNYSESAVQNSYANHVDKIAPVAQLPETVFGFTGMEIGFDGTLCSDNVRINRYEWDFGDGTKATGVRPAHTYQKSGVYSLTLTVRDGAGNEATTSAAVQVMDKENSGMTTVKVLAEDGTPLGGAYVYVRTGNKDQVQLRTDVNGEAKIIAASGVYELAAFAAGYMPGEGTVRISNYETLEETITLLKGDVVTGEMTVERMELDELIEKGVDLSAPENYHTFTFKTELWFASSALPVVIELTDSIDDLHRPGSTNKGVGAGRYSAGKGEIQVELFTEEDEVRPGFYDSYVGITYLQTTQSVSWLKDMYDVQLGIINNADSSYTITNASATLNLPDGMSLASLKSGQTLNTAFEDINGQESASASWVVKGDRNGTFDLSASFHGVLQPFAADIDAQFETKLECEVPAGEGLHIYVYPEDAYYPGENYYIQVEIRNESNRNFYNLTTTLGEYIQSTSVTEVYVKDYYTGHLLKDIRTGGKTYRSASAAKCRQLPVLYGGDMINVGVLAPGETIYATYCQRMGERDSQDTYFTLIDNLVTVLEGENTGAEVTCVPIKSHIYKYVMLVGKARDDVSREEFDELMGDPVDMTTGAFLQDISTISLSGGSALSFDLSYNSMLADYEGEGGYGWSHDYEQRIEDYGSSLTLRLDSHTKANFVNEEADANISYGTINDGTITLDGQTEYTGTYYPTDSVMDGWNIEKSDGGYVVNVPDGSFYNFDKEGRLIRMNDNSGKDVSVSYGDGTMTLRDEITADTLTVTYDGDGYISSVADNKGRIVTLEHNGGNLTAITGVDGKRSAYGYDSGHHMINATNAAGLTYLHNTYDKEGRILTQKEAGKAGVMTVDYEDTESGGMLIEVNDGAGGNMEIETDEKGQKIRTVDVDGGETEYLYDKDGNLLDETDPMGNTVMYQYDENGSLIRTYDASGNITYMDYDENGNSTRVYDRTGNGTTFTYDEKNRLIRSIGPLGEVTRYAYDEYGNIIRRITDGKGVLQYEYENGLLVSQTDAAGNKTTFEHDGYGNVVKKTDAQGNETLYTYSRTGELLSRTEADGTYAAYAYDDLGQVTGVTLTAPDGNTKTETYTYDGAGRNTAVTNAAGETTAYTYDERGNKTSVTYPDGTKDTFTYDRAGNLIRKTTAAGVTTEYTYDLNRNTLSETTGGATTRYEYYPNGKLYRQSMPDGQTLTYTYDNSWNCILIMDGEGNSTGYTYDSAGNLTSERDALGNRTQYLYDTHGRCIQVIDPNGNKTSYSYDANDNCTRTVDALGNVTEMTYDSLNRLISTTHFKGGVPVTVSYAYDTMGRVTSVTDEEGITYEIGYDSFGNQVSITDGEGNITGTSTYDAAGRVTQTTDALGNRTQYSYDPLGSIKTIADCLNRTTSYTYDADGRLLSVTDTAGNTASQTYDARGNVTSITDAKGGTTTYSYDSMNRVTELVNAIGAKESYTYNAQGLLSETKDSAGGTTTYTYDAAGRLTAKKDGLGAVRYTYDGNGNVLTVSDKNGTIERTYDALNRVTAVTDYNGDTIAYAYDELGNRTSITYPGGEKVRYTYDKTGRLLTVTDARGRVTGYTYDRNGRLIETKRADGSRELCTYNAAGQLTALRDETPAGKAINEYTYEYDGNGNITKITGMESGMSEGAQTSIAALDGGAPGNTITPAAQNPDGTVTVSVSMAYDEDNRLLTYNGQAVEYDAAGNMTRGPINGAMADLTYDCRNRLVRVTEAGGAVTEYEYDAENIRTAVTAGGTRTEYTTDRESTYTQTLVRTEYEKNPFGSYTEEKSRTTYTYGLGLAGERRDDGEEFYYHYNHIGSTMAVSDGGGNVLYRFAYDAYGELSGITTDDGVSLKTTENTETTAGYTLAQLAHAAGIDYLYNGQYGVMTDRNGLYYMRARYYCQDIKRFINRDVVSGDITASQSLNRYSYVQGNPVSLTDPFGLCPDPNSNFKNFCRVLYYADWNAIGHATLDALGFVWDGFDVANAIWYACEGKTKEAIASAVCALPAVGMFAGGLLEKAGKFKNAGKAVKHLSRMTQGAAGTVVGAQLAYTGLTNIINGIESGTLSAGDVATFLGGIAITALSGKNMVSSGRALQGVFDDVGKVSKAGKGQIAGSESSTVSSKGGSDLWDMTEGGGIINGREYSQHALERMAPDTPSVRAELSRRAESLAESKGLQVGTSEYYQFCQKYVDPRNIPPSVIEDAIRNTTAVSGHTAGTFVHQTADVIVIVNDTGKVITVIPK